MGRDHPAEGPFFQQLRRLSTTILCRTSITSSAKKGTKKSISRQKWRQGLLERRDSRRASEWLDVGHRQGTLNTLAPFVFDRGMPLKNPNNEG